MPPRIDEETGRNKLRTYEFFDDFEEFTDAKTWTQDVSGTGTVLIENVGDTGFVTLRPQLATANAHCFIGGTAQYLTLHGDRPMIIRSRFVNVNDDNNFFVGVMTVIDSTSLLDGDAGPDTSKRYAGIYKRGTETKWRCASLVESNSEVDDLTNVDTDIGFFTIEMRIEGSSSNEVRIHYAIDVDGGYNFKPMERDNCTVITHRHDVGGGAFRRVRPCLLNKLDASGNGDELDVDFFQGILLRQAYDAGQ